MENLDNVQVELTKDKVLEKAIESVDSFAALYKLVERVGEVAGSQKIYTSNELINLIESVRNGNSEIDSITRTYNLRAKVAELLSK